MEVHRPITETIREIQIPLKKKCYLKRVVNDFRMKEEARLKHCLVSQNKSSRGNITSTVVNIL